ncbi:MAG: hypothetical protein Udaeo2_27410 [Candidatus Udaeobacter sp.]|nr:MAG: hypothetical protein Udaeo2_27410 [Candidatus Udaeobacter sp.]
MLLLPGYGLSARSIEFLQQLLLQMTTRGLFNRTPLGSHRFLLCLTFFSRSSSDRLCQMRNLRTARTDVSLLRFRIGVHEETLTLLISDKKDGNSSKLKND